MKAYGVWIDRYWCGEVYSSMDKKIFFDKHRATLRADDIEREGAELSAQAKRCEECCLHNDLDDWIKSGRLQKDFEAAHGACCALERWDVDTDCINYVPAEEDVCVHLIEFEVAD